MMTSDLKSYPAYKDSGIEWLGEIPAHWEVTRADSLFRYEKIQIEPSTISEQSVFHYSITAIQETGDGIFESPTGIDSAKLRVFGRRILVSKLNPRKGVVLIADEKPVPTICSTEFVPLEIRSCDLGWAYHLLASEPTRQRLSAVVRSATRSHQRAEIAEVLKMWHGVPPLPEQRAIAAFLDHETAKIDALVAKKERLIELLQEKRTALISHAVTKGLDPDVPLKDSGVEWLGEIPAHWEIRRLKHAVNKIGSGKTPSGGAERYVTDGIMLLRSQNIHFRGLELSDVAYIDAATDDEMSNSRVHEDDVLLNITGASLGRCSVARLKGLKANVNQHVCIIRPDQRQNDPAFLAYSIESQSLQDQIFNNENGVSRDALNFEQIGSLVLAEPTTIEQRAIIAFLDHETAKIDALVAKVQEAIDRLKELRTALISAAVTGKIDVREAAA